MKKSTMTIPMKNSMMMLNNFKKLNCVSYFCCLFVCENEKINIKYYILYPSCLLNLLLIDLWGRCKGFSRGEKNSRINFFTIYFVFLHFPFHTIQMHEPPPCGEIMLVHTRMWGNNISVYFTTFKIDNNFLILKKKKIIPY